nr:POU class 2 homeobox associating factor 3 isoform X4 [Rattus norvegicus]
MPLLKSCSSCRRTLNSRVLRETPAPEREGVGRDEGSNRVGEWREKEKKPKVYQGVRVKMTVKELLQQRRAHQAASGATDCTLSLNQRLPHPVIFRPESFPPVSLVKKTLAAWTRSSSPTFRLTHPRSPCSTLHKSLPTISQRAVQWPLSAITW